MRTDSAQDRPPLPRIDATPSHRAALLALLVATAGCVFWLMDDIWSGSVDFAHHYALVRFLADHLALPTAGDPALHAMSIYPPATHAIAALVGRIVGSPLLGMQVTALCALAFLWGSFAWWLSLLPTRAFAPTAVVLAVLLAIAAAIGFELHGEELVSNYLYSQLVGEAVAMCVVAWVVRLWITDGLATRASWILAIAAPIVGSLHLLPGLLLLATFCVSVVLDAAARPRGALRVCVKGGAWALVSLAATIASPAFRAMRSLSENEGSLDLRFIHSNAGLIVLASVVLVVSIVLGLWWTARARRGHGGEWAAVKMMSAYGAGLSLLCLAQLAALLFGEGSSYACRKYAFALDVALCGQIAVAIGLVLARELPSPLQPTLRWVRVLFPAACVVLVFAATLSPRTRVASLHALMEVDAFAADYRRLALPRTDAGEALAIGIHGLTPVMNYMVSIATLRATAQPNGFDVLNDRTPTDRKALGFVFTSPGTQWDASQCRRHHATNDVVVIDAQCVFHEKSTCASRVNFATTGRVALDAIEGFSAPWSEGRWSEGLRARFQCAVEGEAPRHAHFETFGYVKAGHQQRMQISVNGGVPVEAVFVTDGEQKVVDVPLPAPADGQFTFQFSFPDAVSPYTLGVSADRRALAVGIRAIRFQ